MFENFERSVCAVFKEAEKQCQLLGHEYVGTEHLILAILKNESLASELLIRYGVNYDDFFEKVKENLPPVNKSVFSNQYTPLLKRIISNCMKDDIVKEINLLYSVLNEGEGVAIRILMSMGVDVDLLYNEIQNKNDFNNNLEIIKYGKVLNETVDLSEKVIGREKEINLLIETLLRKKKNNPLLLGEAGVGKSAIVEELARRIVRREVPYELIDSKIICLEMGNLISGTRYRGEFEERLMNIVNEVTQNKEIILFIDEVHSMVNAGAAEGAISAADILKPALARGEIKCIGATTKKEYEKYLLVDKALARRFDPIFISEPNEKETFDILVGVKDEYIRYHGVNITDDMLKNLIHLSCVYFPNLRNPDKSIELLDSVMAYVKLKNADTIIRKKEEKLNVVLLAKYKELENGNFKKALASNIEENKLKKELKLLRNGRGNYVKDNDILDVLEHKNNIIIKNNKLCLLPKIKNKCPKKVFDKMCEILNKTEGVVCFWTKNMPCDFACEIANLFKYKYFELKENNLTELYQTIKYYPSMVIVIKEETAFYEKIIKEIVDNDCIDYNGEKISFHNAIFIINNKQNSLGFISNDNKKYLDFTNAIA